jgi:hypothetical protein
MKTRLVKALSALAVGGMAFSFATAAQAVTVQFASTVSFTESVLKVDFASAGLNDTLTVGVPLTIDHFISVTVDTGSWSASGSAITANFLFTIPTPNGATTDVGSITASQVNGSSASGTLAVTWPNQPVHFLFTDGTALDVTLGNLNVSCNPAANNCLAAQDPFYMSGTFLVLNGPTTSEGPPIGETPLPGALPLMASGLSALGLICWRRKRKAQAAA